MLICIFLNSNTCMTKLMSPWIRNGYTLHTNWDSDFDSIILKETFMVRWEGGKNALSSELDEKLFGYLPTKRSKN